MNKINRFFKQFSQRSKLVAVAAVFALTAIAVPAISQAGFGPERPTKAYTPGVAGFDHVTFNSFTGVPNVGDERNFFNGKYPGGTAYTDPLSEVKDGDVLTLQVYVHNNADSSLNDAPGNPGVAVNTKVRVALPTGSAKTQQASAFISADNAQPQVVSDTLDFGALNGGMFELDYVAGSAAVKGNFIDTKLSDSIVTTGAPIGTDALNGKLKGCFKELVYVTLQVKVKMPQYTIKKDVRMNGGTAQDWVESKNVKAGDTVNWRITFENKGATALNAVKIVDQVPAGLTVVPNTVKLINGNYPSPGYFYPANAVQDNGRTINVDIGNYNPGGIAYVYFSTTIDKPAATVCSPIKIVNKAFATPQGYGAIWDVADVTVPGNECVTDKPVYSCDLLTLTPTGKRTITVKLAKYTEKNAKLKAITYTFGDGNKILTDKTSVDHTYAADGTYKVTATLTFTVDGKDVTGITSAACAQTVTFSPDKPPVVVPPVTPPVLPVTGTGSTVAIFAAVASIATLGHYTIRRLMAR